MLKLYFNLSFLISGLIYRFTPLSHADNRYIHRIPAYMLIIASLFFFMSVTACSDMYNDTRSINGEWQWTRMYGVASANLMANSVSSDRYGNVYVAGVTNESTNNDWLIMKYDSKGSFVWRKTFGGDNTDELYEIIFDNDGNAYGVGTTASTSFLGVTPPGSNGDIAIVKFDSAWNPIWVRVYGGSWSDIAYSVAIDSKKKVYVAGIAKSDFNGQTVNATNVSDPVIIKLDKDGNLVQTLIRNAVNENGFRSITIDDYDNVIAAGFATGGIDGQSFYGVNDIMVTKFGPDLGYKATRICGSSASDVGYSVKTDSSGNIYIAGESAGNIHDQTGLGSSDIVILKYSTNLDLQWVRVSGSSSQDKAYSLAIDAMDNPCIAGYTYGSIDGQPYSGLADTFVSKYSSTGERFWTRMRGGSNNDFLSACGLSITPDGSLFTAGSTNSPSIDGQTLTGSPYDILLLNFW